jgi:hypothetical protein
MGCNINFICILNLPITQCTNPLRHRVFGASLQSYPWNGELRKLIRRLARTFLELNVSLLRADLFRWAGYSKKIRVLNPLASLLKLGRADQP